MKKSLILAVIAVAALTAACRKDRTCTCNVTSTSTPSVGSGSTASWTSTESMTGVKKGDPRFNCNSRTVTSTDTYTFGGGYTVANSSVYDCTLD